MVKVVLFSCQKAWAWLNYLVVISMVVMFGPTLLEKSEQYDVAGRAVRLWDSIFGSAKKVLDDVRIKSVKGQIAKRTEILAEDRAVGAVNLAQLSGDDHESMNSELERSYAAQRKAIDFLDQDLAVLQQGKVNDLTREMAESEMRAADDQRRITREKGQHVADLHGRDRDKAAKAALGKLTDEEAVLNSALQALDAAAREGDYPVKVGKLRLTGQKHADDVRVSLSNQVADKKKQILDITMRNSAPVKFSDPAKAMNPVDPNDLFLNGK